MPALSKCKSALARRADMVSDLNMVAEGLHERALLRTCLSQFDQRLQDLRKQRVALQAAFVEVTVHFPVIDTAQANDLLSGCPRTFRYSS